MQEMKKAAAICLDGLIRWEAPDLLTSTQEKMINLRGIQMDFQAVLDFFREMDERFFHVVFFRRRARWRRGC